MFSNLSPVAVSCLCILRTLKVLDLVIYNVQLLWILHVFVTLWHRTLWLYLCQCRCSAGYRPLHTHLGDWWRRTYIATDRASDVRLVSIVSGQSDVPPASAETTNPHISTVLLRCKCVAVDVPSDQLDLTVAWSYQPPSLPNDLH